MLNKKFFCGSCTDKINPADLNKIGYVDYEGKLSEYTSDMIGSDMSIKNNASCSKKLENISI